MKEGDAPTRAEISEYMDIEVTGKTIQDRNYERYEAVKNAVSPEVFNIIKSDLPSYPEWEVEDAP